MFSRLHLDEFDCYSKSRDTLHRTEIDAFFFTEIDIPAAQSTAVSSVNAALEAAEKIGYPVILRSAFTLGGLGSGFANNPDELRDLSAKSLSLSPQVLIERSMKGWKELEYEVVRDAADVRTLKVDYRILNRLTILIVRTRSSAVTWRTSTLLVHILVTLSSWLLRRRCRTTNTTCCVLQLSRLFAISVSWVNATSSMRSTPHRGSTVSLRSMPVYLVRGKQWASAF